MRVCSDLARQESTFSLLCHWQRFIRAWPEKTRLTRAISPLALSMRTEKALIEAKAAVYQLARELRGDPFILGSSLLESQGIFRQSIVTPSAISICSPSKVLPSMNRHAKSRPDRKADLESGQLPGQGLDEPSGYR